MVEIKAIEKNKTWELIGRPEVRHNLSQVGLQDEANCRLLNSTSGKKILATTMY